MTYNEILDQIRNLTIQGAEKIALAGVEAFALKLAETKDYDALKKFFEEVKTTRPTEPAMRNAVRYCLENYTTKPNIVEEVNQYFQESQNKIAEYGAKKIETGMIVFTHCHSSTVEAVILKAFANGKKFIVYNTETRPKFQGRITAQNLAKAGIEVHHFVDSAGRLAIQKSDLFLFGCDAITSEGRIINKIGTAYLLQFANTYDIKSFSCTNSWKFDPDTIYGMEEEIENRDPKEIWDNPPPNVIVHNPAFEAVSPDLMTGMISELGVFKAESLINRIKEAYPWMM